MWMMRLGIVWLCVLCAACADKSGKMQRLETENKALTTQVRELETRVEQLSVAQAGVPAYPEPRGSVVRPRSAAVSASTPEDGAAIPVPPSSGMAVSAGGAAAHPVPATTPAATAASAASPAITPAVTPATTSVATATSAASPAALPAAHAGTSFAADVPRPVPASLPAAAARHGQESSRAAAPETPSPHTLPPAGGKRAPVSGASLPAAGGALPSAHQAAVPSPASQLSGASLPASLPAEGTARESVAPVPRLSAVPATAPASAQASPAREGGIPSEKNAVEQRVQDDILSGASSEEIAYKSALALALAGRTSAARQAFAQLRQQHPQGGHAADTQFWLAECQYRQGHYRDAAREFEVMSTQYGGHYKAADAQFKVGISYARLGDSEGAARAFRQVLAQFPQSDAARMVRQRKLVQP